MRLDELLDQGEANAQRSFGSAFTCAKKIFDCGQKWSGEYTVEGAP